MTCDVKNTFDILIFSGIFFLYKYLLKSFAYFLIK